MVVKKDVAVDTTEEDVAALLKRIADLEKQVPAKPKVFKPEDLKHLPDTQIGVSERSNIRMILMAKPVCPVVDDPEADNYTGDSNCQTISRGVAGWWNYCTKQGHEPYYSITKTIKREPIVADDGVITGYREMVKERRRLNTSRVAISTRLNSGRGLEYAKVLKGRKTLEDMGYWGKCEFRACEIDWKIDTRYGRFCNDRHARLIAADVEAVMLEIRKKRAMNKQLTELGDLSRVQGEGYRLQEVPDIESQDVQQRLEPITAPVEGEE